MGCTTCKQPRHLHLGSCSQPANQAALLTGRQAGHHARRASRPLTRHLCKLQAALRGANPHQKHLDSLVPESRQQVAFQLNCQLPAVGGGGGGARGGLMLWRVAAAAAMLTLRC